MDRSTVGTGRVAATLLGTDLINADAPVWEFGTCSNCDLPVAATCAPQTFCGDTCRHTATLVRDLRRARALGDPVDPADLDRHGADVRRRVLAELPLRGCDAEDWATFVRWFQAADQR